MGGACEFTPAPLNADPANARRILADLQRDSRAFGTTIAIRDSVGVVSIP